MNHKVIGIGILGITAILQIIWIIQSDSLQDSAFHIVALAILALIIKKALSSDSSKK